MYVITGASDKIAQQTSSQTIVVTLMSGILIANYKAATMIGNTGMVVGLLFAFLGGAYIAKFGAKKATSLWSAVAIALSVASILFCVILGPDGMKQIGVMGIPMMIYVVLQVLTSGVKMILTTASGTMRADVTDYELERSGNYMPGTVGGVYSFVDKIISSLASTIAAFCVAFIGYTTTMPQMGDPVTWPLFWMAMILTFGLPILGWLCNVFAMKGYELSKERMVEVQTNVAERKAAAKK
jgi:Na+/melibiose symporter-like transporter